MEPKYAGSFDDDGNYSELESPGMPKWRLPSTDWQERVLHAVGLKYWPKGFGMKDLRAKMLVIEKSMQPLSAIEPKYPTEFIDDVIRWYEKRRFLGQNALVGMLNQFNNDDWRARVIMGWRRNHPDIVVTNYREELPPQEEWKDD